jgi:hypothetical protein
MHLRVADWRLPLSMHSRPEARALLAVDRVRVPSFGSHRPCSRNDKIAISRTRPNRRIAGAACAEELDVRATGPVRGEISHKPRTQVLIEEQFHAAV